MWSDKYYYLNIYKDKNISSYFETRKLREFISTFPEFEKSGAFTFKNKEPFPHTTLLMLNARSFENHKVYKNREIEN